MGLAISTWAGPAFKDVTPNLPSVQRLGKFELTFSLSNTSYTNAFDPDQINVSAIFKSPSHKAVTVYGFYYQEFKRTGPPEKLTGGDWSWKVRFTPNQVGDWTYSLKVVDAKNGKGTYGPGKLTCVASGRKGYVRVSPKDHRYFEYEDGTQYFPVGANVGWAEDPGSKYAHGGGTFDYDHWLSRMGAQGANFARYWMCPWYHSVEWKQTGLGNYTKLMSDAWRLDHDIDVAWDNNIMVMLMILNHGAVSTVDNPNWQDSPYNKANGGPCANTHEFFTNPEALKYFKRRLRYIVARYGYASNLIWEMCNEIDQTDKFKEDPKVRADVAQWTDQMAHLIKSMDKRHIVTTSFSNDNNDTPTWNLPVIDFTQFHYYSGASALEDAIRSVIARYRTQFPKKPVFNGEFGVNWDESKPDTLDPKGIEMHNVMWGSALGEGAGAGAMWFWGDVIDPHNLYPQFRSISNFTKAVDFAGSGFVFKMPACTSQTLEDLNVAPGIRSWGVKAGTNKFTVSASGDVTPGQGNLCQFLFSANKAEFRNPPTFKVDYPAAGQFKVEVSDLNPSKKAKLLIQVDGKTALETAVKDHTIYAVPVSAGPHSIFVDSVGDDWFAVGAYLFSPYVAGIKVYALQGPKTVAAWIVNRKYNDSYVRTHGVPPAVGGTVHFTGLAHDGNWRIQWWNTSDGTIESNNVLNVKGGKLDLLVPPMVWDWAIKLVYMGPAPTGQKKNALKVKSDFHWPHGAKGAVSLTYDDAIPSQIHVAAPALDQYGLKGTFFVECDSESVKKERGQWQALSREGHEIGSHTMVHPCDKGQDWVKKNNALEVYTLDRMEKELDDSITFLKDLSSKEPLTFAYPCGESYVGEGAQKKSYVPLVAQRFLAARSTENALAVPGAFSLPEVPTIDGWTSGDQLINWVQKAVDKGAWVVFMFHGVGGDYLPVSAENHKKLAEYLAKNRDTVWTGTFGEVAKYVKSQSRME